MMTKAFLLDIVPMVYDNDIVSKNGRLLLNRLKVWFRTGGRQAA